MSSGFLKKQKNFHKIYSVQFSLLKYNLSFELLYAGGLCIINDWTRAKACLIFSIAALSDRRAILFLLWSCFSR